jgi:CheY-like chemotaxis protein
MDIQMPVKDGLTATREIRKYELDNSLPRVMIVALTAHAYEDERKNGFEAGVDDYLIKPIKKTDLLRAISISLQLFP